LGVILGERGKKAQGVMAMGGQTTLRGENAQPLIDH